ncbi:MAG: cobalt ECF transporter T component CbiQ, partial [Anaerolineales bacterium]
MHVSLLDVYRPRDAWVHQLDPRVKILVAILFILTAVTLPEGAWIAYALLLLIIVVLASLARLGVGFTIKRSLIALPFVLAALPLPFLTPGEILFTIPILGWGVTTAGTLRFFTILVRTWIAVQAGVLLSATTKVSDILWGLGRLGVPRIIVATVGFMVRYLFVLADEALRMIRARISRSPRLAGARPPGFVWQGRTVGMMVGSLFLRSLERSERVYAAMVSRGYDGQLRTFEPSSMESLDWTA